MPIRKIINDPVHGFITIDDELIYDVLSHPAFQRLRRIKQMALAYLVYPGAVHTRLHHALGAYHLMGMAIDELRAKNIEITHEEEQAAKLAILLHDIGHGPFSHALENTLVNIHHETISKMLIEYLNKEFDGQLSLALEVFKGTYHKKFLHQLISSQLDVDRLDYLARDSFFTGVSEGVVGYDRIIKMFSVHKDELVVEEKGIHSVEKFLIARRLMYWQVYLHKTVLSSELLLVNILKRAKELTRGGHQLFSTPALSVFLDAEISEKNLPDNFIDSFILLDDNDIASAIKVWSRSEDGILKELSLRLLNRKLFKVKYFNPKDGLDIEDMRAAVQANLKLSDEAMAYFFMKDETSNMLYSKEFENIKILKKTGELIDVSEVDHPLINSSVTEQVKKYYICYAQ
jgi:HD superfamily phosphohydrolase